MEVKISKMTGKLYGVDAVNTSPLDNGWCRSMELVPDADHVCVECFSFAMLRGSRKNCRASWAKNGEVLSEGPLKFVPFFHTFLGRFNGHGELINRQHAANLCTIARHNPQTRFALWTKRVDLVKRLRRPKNMWLIYSNPRIDAPMEKPPRPFDKVFNVVRSDGPYADRINCGPCKCVECERCYSEGCDVIFEALKKRS